MLEKLGIMTESELADIDYVHPSNDVAHIISMERGEPFVQSKVVVGYAYVGLQVRTPYNFIRELVVNHCFSDLVAARCGDIHIGTFKAIDIYDYKYGPLNHKDVFQIYNLCSTTNKLVKTPVRNVKIDKLELTFGGNDKHIIHCTETCGYEDFELFKYGCDVVDVRPTTGRHLISTINAVNWVIGSPEHPLDPTRMGDRIIRVSGVKQNSPPSKNIKIYAYEGLKLELDASARAALNLVEIPR